MKISAFMPTFNRPDFIVKAVEAILAQDYDNFEIIVKDGGDSIEHLLPKDARIRYIGGRDRGITDAMNQAMAKATGDIFVWANDDDLIAPGTFRFVIDNIGGHKWLVGRILMGDQLYGETYNYERLKQNNIVPQPAVYWKRDLYNELGGMCEDQDLTSDYEYWLRIGKKYEPIWTDRVLANYTVHEGQITQKITGEQLAQAEQTRKKYL